MLIIPQTGKMSYDENESVVIAFVLNDFMTLRVRAHGGKYRLTVVSHMPYLFLHEKFLTIDSFKTYPLSSEYE